MAVQELLGAAVILLAVGALRGRDPPVRSQKANTKPNGSRTLNRTTTNEKADDLRTAQKPQKQRTSTMHDTETYTDAITQPYAQPYTERTYTAAEIAAEHKVTDATVRNRWYDWLLKVAPAQLLKDGKRYTELAHTLFGEFAAVDQKERPAWVADAKQRYSPEWSSVGVIDCEVMPENVGSTLALIQTNLSVANEQLTTELTEVTDFISRLNAADADFTDAELESWQANGARKAVAQFKTEEIARAQTLNALRQQRLGGKQQ